MGVELTAVTKTFEPNTLVLTKNTESSKLLKAEEAVEMKSNTDLPGSEGKEPNSEDMTSVVVSV